MAFPSSLKLLDNVEIQLLPASLEDIPQMAEIFVVAHDSEVTVFNQMKDVPRRLIYKYYASTFTSLFANEKGIEFWKIVEGESGNIIGTACWHLPSLISSQDHYPGLPAGSNESICEQFFGYMETKEKKWFNELGGGENFFMLHYIAILPVYQGKGIGRWAMQPKLQAADFAGKKTFLIGSPLAQSLYARLGFEEVDSFEIDLEGRGMKGENHWAVMVREPGSL